MVNFTAVVNNEDMVKGLNKLIQSNASILASLDTAKDALDDSALVAEVDALRTMHEHHIERIGETIRVLGGAPTQVTGSHWMSEGKMQLSKLGKADGLASAIHSEEDKLQGQYSDTLEELKVSPEVVEVVRDLRDDAHGHLEHFESANARRH